MLEEKEAERKKCLREGQREERKRLAGTTGKVEERGSGQQRTNEMRASEAPTHGREQKRSWGPRTRSTLYRIRCSSGGGRWPSC